MATERGTPQLSGSTSLAAGVGLSRPFYIVLVSSPASAPLYINQRNYSPCQTVVIRNAWLEAGRNKVGFGSLPSFCAGAWVAPALLWDRVGTEWPSLLRT